MRRIRSKGTLPELFLRKLVHALGFRYRLHVSELPGKPDLVFPRLQKVIFLHGCFWHLHPGCREGRIPGSRREYWEPKLLKNVERDRKNQSALRSLGWRVLTVWECETRNPEDLKRELLRFLES